MILIGLLFYQHGVVCLLKTTTISTNNIQNKTSCNGTTHMYKVLDERHHLHSSTRSHASSVRSRCIKLTMCSFNIYSRRRALYISNRAMITFGCQERFFNTGNIGHNQFVGTFQHRCLVTLVAVCFVKVLTSWKLYFLRKAVI